MKVSIIKSLFIVLYAVVHMAAFPQDIEIGPFLGTSYYIGELNPQKQFFFTRPAFGGIGRFNIDTRWAVKFNAYWGEIAGDDAVSKVNLNRNLRFESSITEISTQLEFNFFNYFTGSKLTYFTPYLFTGPAFFIFNPKASYNGEMIALVNLNTEGQSSPYSLYGFATVFGLGFKYSVNSRLGLAAEWGLRKAFTDYLDDISTTYYLDFSTLNPAEVRAYQVLSDPAATKHLPGMQRGNSQNDDWYSFAGLTITYRFTIGEKSTCSDFETSNNK